tara:strand:+ start:696 stop:1184 length:489 start_codon:yes stop_codon:yes gene_type:complete
MCLSLVVSSCGFYLQGQSQRTFPSQLNLYVDDALLAAVVSENLRQHQVSLNLLESVVEADTRAPTLQLTRTLRNKSALTLDTNGEALVWRYTLSSHYLFVAAGTLLEADTQVKSFSLAPISVSTDLDLSGTNATVNERVEADSWALLYQQLGTRIARQLSFE